MIRLKENVDIKELEKYGFVGNQFVREGFYRVYITKNHRNIQIETFDNIIMAKRVQELIYDLTKADLVEKVKQ